MVDYVHQHIIGRLSASLSYLHEHEGLSVGMEIAIKLSFIILRDHLS